MPFLAPMPFWNFSLALQMRFSNRNNMKKNVQKGGASVQILLFSLFLGYMGNCAVSHGGVRHVIYGPILGNQAIAFGMIAIATSLYGLILYGRSAVEARKLSLQGCTLFFLFGAGAIFLPWVEIDWHPAKEPY